MTPVKFSEFFWWAYISNFLIGIKPYDDPENPHKKRTLLDNFLFYAGFINMNFLLAIEVAFLSDSFIKGINFLESTLSMAYIGFLIIGEFKMLCVRAKKQKLTSLMRELYEIYPKTVKAQEAYKISSYLRQSHLVAKSFSSLYFVLISTYNLFAIMEYWIFECWLKLRNKGRSVPYFALLPWDYTNHWSFYLIYISEDLGACSCALGQMSSDLLLCAVATQMIMHYDYVSRSIEGYDLEANKETKNPKIRQKQHEKDLKYLFGIITYHNKLLSLSDFMNDAFGVPLFFNFLIASFVLCFVGFQMTAGNPTYDIQFKLFIFLFSVATQVYLVCHYGQNLIDASTHVAQAIYNHDWSNADVQYKKLLVLIQLRAQKPMYLEATSFVRVSKNTMTSIMQISYKFFALLRTMYAD